MNYAEQVSALEAVVERLVRESGNAQGFDAHTWLAGWLDQGMPALAGRRPADVLREPGIERLCALLARTQSGAYS